MTIIPERHRFELVKDGVRIRCQIRRDRDGTGGIFLACGTARGVMTEEAAIALIGAMADMLETPEPGHQDERREAA